jgi:hypothetical protein
VRIFYLLVPGIELLSEFLGGQLAQSPSDFQNRAARVYFSGKDGCDWDDAFDEPSTLVLALLAGGGLLALRRRS